MKKTLVWLIHRQKLKWLIQVYSKLLQWQNIYSANNFNRTQRCKYCCLWACWQSNKRTFPGIIFHHCSSTLIIQAMLNLSKSGNWSIGIQLHFLDSLLKLVFIGTSQIKLHTWEIYGELGLKLNKVRHTTNV